MCSGSERETVLQIFVNINTVVGGKGIFLRIDICIEVPVDHVFPLKTAALVSFVEDLSFTCRYHEWGMFHPRERQQFLFDSTDESGFCSMIRAMGTEPPTHCHQAQVLMCSEEFPHITSSQTFHAQH